jgi:hypothetical protein
MNERTANAALAARSTSRQDVMRVLACHPACAVGCNECVRLRSESVGAEWEPESRYDSEGGALLRWLGVALVLAFGALVAAHFIARVTT